MVKISIHKRDGKEPFLVTEMSLEDCTKSFDLGEAKFLQLLGDRQPTARKPGSLSENPDPELVIFEVLAGEQTAEIEPGYYASNMTADTVQELLGEE